MRRNLALERGEGEPEAAYYKRMFWHVSDATESIWRSLLFVSLLCVVLLAATFWGWLRPTSTTPRPTPTVPTACRSAAARAMADQRYWLRRDAHLVAVILGTSRQFVVRPTVAPFDLSACGAS